MPRNDGRIEPGQRLNGAISARAWNRMLDAADLVLGEQYGATADGPGGAVHYLSKTTAAWNKGTSQTLNLWAGTPGSESQLSDQVIAWNYTATLPSGLWVVLARANATFYVVAFDYTGLPSYDATKQQVLGHAANGGLSWINTTACT